MIKTTIDVKNLIDQDPNGLSPHTPGAKLDANKPNCDLVFGGFPNALLEVAKVGTFGAQRYSDDGWKSVSNGVQRYRSAAYRHLLSNDFLDNDSNLPHLAHAAWNCLAAFELSLSKIGVKVNNEDICGLCGKPGANKHKHPYHWPGEVNPEGEFVHDECEQYERDRAFIEFRKRVGEKGVQDFLKNV